jgi:hypothetical protein
VTVKRGGGRESGESRHGWHADFERARKEGRTTSSSTTPWPEEEDPDAKKEAPLREDKAHGG